jgi:hypothetical protein
MDSGMVKGERASYPRVCEGCKKKELEACDHCKISHCRNQKEVTRSLCRICLKIHRKTTTTTTTTTKKNQNRGAPKTVYEKICHSCLTKDSTSKTCQCCKQLGCPSKTTKPGRSICQACATKEDHILYDNSVTKKRQGVIFLQPRKEHAKEAADIIGGLDKQSKGGKSTHFVDKQNELNNFPAHQYHPIQFYDKELLDKMTSVGGGMSHPDEKIKVLGDGDTGAKLKDCLAMEGLFKVIAIEGKKMVLSRLGVTDVNFGAASAHLQDSAEAKGKYTTMYHGHRDKPGVGDIVMFHQVAGISFTFIAVHGKEHKAYFDKASQGYQRYAEWKAQSKNEKSKMILAFENKFKKEAERLKTTCVEVYELRAGNSLIFAAATCYHASIIPVQVEETRRALVVFHALETVMNLENRRKRNAAEILHTMAGYENKRDVPRMAI